jgi:AcrR family transcriptional regulator
MRHLFWEKGYAATSLDDLCAATGMNRPSLYNAFGDKGQLFKAVMDDYVSEIRPLYERAFRTDGTLKQALTAVYDTAMEIYHDHTRGLGCFMLGAALTDTVRDEEIAALVRERLLEMDRGFDWLMKKAAERGELRTGADAKAMARLAASVHTSISVRMRAGEDQAIMRTYVDGMVDAICG